MWITPGAYIGKKSYFDKVLSMWTENSVQDTNIHQLKNMVKQDLSLNVSLQVLSSTFLFFTELVETKATYR